MIPYKEIWYNIELIQNFNVGFNLKKDKSHIDLTLDDVLQIKDEFSFDTIEYAQNIDDLLINFSDYVDYTFRYKEDSSITRNWFNESMPKPLYKTLNDIYIRFDEPDVLNYAINLRTWLEQLPTVPINKPIKPYVDYLYEKAFQSNCVEAD